MSKQRFRLVFNKTRGMLVAVEESARTAGKGAGHGQAGALGATSGAARAVLRPLAAVLSALWTVWPWGLGWSGLLVLVPAWAVSPVPDANAPSGQRPGVLTSVNGIPVVLLTTPNAAGVSNNKFSDFSVLNGVVLNNSKVDGLTQTAGAVPKNPNLTGDAAKVALVQVTGGLPSTLAGTLEVFGQKASVVVANPNGLAFGNGTVGFATLNVDKFTGTTGSVVFAADGSVQGFNVHGGTITVQGSGGVNTSGLSYFGLIAGAASLNAPVGSNDTTQLQVVAGRNYAFDARTLAVTPTSGGGTGTSGWGITATALGAMHGSEIQLISTGNGWGVNHEGALTAAGQLIVTSDGDVKMHQATSATGNVSVQGANVAIDAGGQLSAANGLVGIQTPGQLALAGDLDAQRVVLGAGSMQQTDAKILSSAVDNGSVTPGVQIQVTGPYQLQGHYTVLDAQGQPLSDAQVVMQGGKVVAVDLGGSPIAGAQILSSTVVQGDTPIFIHAGSMSNQQGVIQGGGSTPTVLKVDGAFDNQGIVVAQGPDLQISAQSLSNGTQGPAMLATAGAVNLDLGSLSNGASGSISAGEPLTVTAATGDLSNAGTLQGAQVTLQAESSTGSLRNTGTVTSQGDLLLLGGAGVSNGVSGSVRAGDRLTVTATTGDVSNAGTLQGAQVTVQANAMTGSLGNTGAVVSLGDLVLRSGAGMSNLGGVLQAQDTLSASAGGELLNDQAGSIHAAGNATLTSTRGSVVNDHGSTVSTDGALVLQAASDVHNASASTFAADTLQLDAGSLKDDSGTIQATHNAVVNVNSLSTGADGTLIAGGDLNITVLGGNLNNAGAIGASRVNAVTELVLASGLPASLTNTGSMKASDTLALTVAGDVLNSGGTLQAGNDLSLNVGTAVVNELHGSILSGQTGRSDLAGTLSVTTGTDLHNYLQSTISATGDVTVQVGRDVNQTSGSAFSGNTLDLTARSLSNDGSFQTHGDTRLRLLRNLTNSVSGSLSADGNLSVSAAAGDATNAGTMSGAYVSLEAGAAGSRIVNSGDMLAAGTLSLRGGGDVHHDGGTLTAGTQVLLDATDNIVLGQGAKLVASQADTGDVVLTAGGDISNHGGELDAKRDVSQKAGGNVLDDSAATTKALRDVSVVAGGDITLADTSSVTANRTLTLQADQTVRTAAGSTLDAHSASVQAQAFDNTGAMTVGGDASIDATRLSNQGGSVRAGGNLSLVTDSYGNTGTLQAGGNAKLDTGDNDLVLNGQALAPTANGTLEIDTGNLSIRTTTQNAGSVVIKASGNVNLWDMLATAGDLDVTTGAGLTIRPGAVMLAMGDTSLNVGTTLSNGSGALLQSEGDVNISAHDLQNEAGARIQAGNNLTVNVTTLANNATLSGSVTSGSAEATSGAYVDPDAGTLRYDTYEMWLSVPTETSTLTLGNHGLMQAGKTLTVNSGTTTNYGDLVAGGAIHVTGTLHNEQPETDLSLLDYLKSSGPFQMNVTPRNSTFNTQLAATGVFQFDNLYAFLNGVLRGTANNGYAHYNQDTLYHYGYDKAIAALQALDTTASPQLGAILGQVLGSTWKAESYSTLQQRWQAFVAAPTSMQFLAANPARVMAGTQLTHSGGALFNGYGSTVAPEQTLDAHLGDDTVQTVLGRVNSRRTAYSTIMSFDVASTLQYINPRLMQAANLPEGAGVPVLGRALAGASAPQVLPMYQTTLHVVDQSKYYGSAYFLGMLGLSSSTPVAVLLDAFLTTQSMGAQLQQAGVAGLLAQQYGVAGTGLVRQLMDNAADAAPRLGLVVGQALTQEQIGRLDEPLVWYETRTVDGRQVLVPKLYLNPGLINRANAQHQTGALLSAGDTVTAQATQIDNVNATIQGGNGITLNADRGITNTASVGLSNSGVSSSNGNVTLGAGGDLLNQGASISGQNVSLTSQGQTTLAESIGLNGQGTSVLGGSKIQAAGSLNVQSGGELTLKAATLSSGGDTSLTAKGSVRSDVLTLANSLATSDLTQVTGGRSIDNEAAATTDQVGSKWTAGGALNVKAGGDIVVTGGTVTADSANLDAGVNVKIAAAEHQVYLKSQKSTVSLHSEQATGVGNHHYVAVEDTVTGTEGTQTTDAFQATALTNKTFDGSSQGAYLGSLKGGIEITSDVTQTNSTHFTNAGFNVTHELTLQGSQTGGTVDFGGATLNAQTINVNSAWVDTTKYTDTTKTTEDSRSYLVGVHASSTVSPVQMANDAASAAQQEQGGATMDGGRAAMLAGEMVGDTTNLIFGQMTNNTIGVGVNADIKKTSTTTTSENATVMNAKTINITSRVGDIRLNGVQSNSADLHLQSAGDVVVRAAKSTTSSETDENNFSANGDAAASAAGIAAEFKPNVSAQISVGEQHTHTSETDTNYTNSSLTATNLTIITRGQLALQGANLSADNATLDVGSLKVESLQDTQSVKTQQQGGSLAVGIQRSSAGAQLGAVGAGVNFGYGSTTSAQVAEQSGIDVTGTLSGTVHKDLTLTGAHITAGKDSSLNVGGAVTAQTLQDNLTSSSKTVGFTAAGQSNGQATSTMSFGAGQSQDKQVTQNATVSGVQLVTNQKVSGDLNTDASKESVTTKDEKLIGVTMSLYARKGPAAKKDTKTTTGAQANSAASTVPGTPTRSAAQSQAGEVEPVVADESSINSPLLSPSVNASPLSQPAGLPVLAH